MLYLPKPKDKDLIKYFNLVKDDILNALTNCKLKKSVKVYIEKNLEEIITSPHEKLLTFSTKIRKDIIPNYDPQKFREYFKAKIRQNKKKEVRGDKTLIKQYKAIEPIYQIFNYTGFLSGEKKRAYILANILNRNTCTYCNRLYTLTISAKLINKASNGDLVVRPQFDHWFAKKYYPVLALSFYNLIPSCSLCNSSIKGETEFDLKKHVHAYKKEANQNFSFSYKLKDLETDNVTLKVNPKSKIANTLAAFRIKEVYNAHSNLELKDLLDLRYKYPKNYLKILLERTFSNLNLKPEDAYRFLFGIEIIPEKYHKRPFSKFKHDIIKELLKR